MNKVKIRIISCEKCETNKPLEDKGDFFKCKKCDIVYPKEVSGGVNEE